MPDMNDATRLALRKPFPPESVGKLPKSACGACSKSQNKRCERHTWVSNCPECHGGHTSAAIHLDYVGHAAVTERLLTVDPLWSWEPLALDPTGLPALDRARKPMDQAHGLRRGAHRRRRRQVCQGVHR